MRQLSESLAAAALAATIAPACAAAQAPAPHLKSVRCYSACASKRTVYGGGRVVVRGHHLVKGLRALVPVTTGTGTALRSTKTRLTRSGTLIVRIPRDGRSGKLYVQLGDGTRSNGGKLKVSRAGQTGARPAHDNPLEGNGMWIWETWHSSGGDLDSIAAMARAHDIDTLIVKSGDGRDYWDQFSPELVRRFHQAGLDVCAWQFVYGTYPGTEASIAAKAIRTGADCFVIDAEGQYEGRYKSARTYMSRLRAAAGPSYPIALASFPYVDYHPRFPFSVFFGPGGAQYNAPQAYWKDIGVSVDTIMSHMYRYNRPYGVPIFPLGQLYQSPSSGEIKRFRQLARAYGSDGVSWWDYQEAGSKQWNAVSASVSPYSGKPLSGDYVSLAKGAKGDLVVWAQLHLRAAGQDPPTDGGFDAATKRAVVDFQTDSGLPATGTIDTATWQALLRYAPGSTAKTKAAGARAKRDEISPPAER